MAGLFQVLWGQSDGTFKKAEALKGTDGEPLIIPVEGEQDIVEGICTRPTAVDWDGDGDLDLVVGNFSGSFYVFIGEGGGTFQPQPEPIQTGDERLKISGAHSDPFVVDWDGDGDLDLLSGSSGGGAFWAENTAGKGHTPELKPFQTLIKSAQKVEYGKPLSEDDLVGPAHASRVWVDDVNEDGKLDILVGDNVTLISPAEGLSDAEFEDKFADWQKAIQEASTAQRDESTDEEQRKEARKRLRELYEKRAEFMKEERTGFVWLYRQK
jgi:hypothetical protein